VLSDELFWGLAVFECGDACYKDSGEFVCFFPQPCGRSEVFITPQSARSSKEWRRFLLIPAMRLLSANGVRLRARKTPTWRSQTPSSAASQKIYIRHGASTTFATGGSSTRSRGPPLSKRITHPTAHAVPPSQS